MKVIRLAGLAIVAVLAVGLAAVSTSSAASYLFRATNVGNTFSGLSLAGTLKAGTDVVTCKDDVNAGTIANVHLIGPFDIKFTGCTSSNSTQGGCPVNSEGAEPEEILTRTVHALLGLVLPLTGLGLGGLLVLPTSGKLFVALAANECTPTTLVTGTTAGLLESPQLGTLVTEALVLFNNSIKEIDTLAGLTNVGLSAFGEAAALVTVEHLTFNQGTEVEVP
jgi:hypothetical protein